MHIEFILNDKGDVSIYILSQPNLRSIEVEQIRYIGIVAHDRIGYHNTYHQI